MTPSRSLVLLSLVCALAQTAGCSPGYFLQATAGQMAIARASRPVTEVLADPSTAPELRGELARAEDALRFAHEELALPDNGSYREYADVHRPFAVWNVFAAPELSLALHEWCFPITGCVVYRGYFDEGRAREYGAHLAAEHYDTYVVGVAAYSTLGFFRDPILSTVARLPEETLTGLIFHELAHQQLYVAGDTVFNESFATLVEQEGMLRWFESRDDERGRCAYLEGLERERAVNALLDATRRRLAGIYASDTTAEDKLAEKAGELDRLRREYQSLRAGWRRPPYFDAWFSEPLNNAGLGALAAYDQLVGTLRVILEGERGDLRAFYARAARLAILDAHDRAAVLREITRPSAAPADGRCRAASG